jgi:pimeloyl-ACP methyl ester carboxylesterase
MNDLILLHGSTGSAEQLRPLSELLAENYKVHLMDFSGHGKRELTDQAFSIQLFAEDLIRYMNDNSITSAGIFGYSMGGYVALQAAAEHPGRISSIVTLATKFAWDTATAEKESALLNPEQLKQKVPHFVIRLREMHSGEKWETVLLKTAEMMKELPEKQLTPEKLNIISTRCLLMIGDSDKMVSIDETYLAYKNITGSELCVLPGTIHPLEKADHQLLKYMIERFLKSL